MDVRSRGERQGREGAGEPAVRRGTDHLSHIAARFAIEGEVVSVAPHGDGHIHDTYVAVARLRSGRRCYILQHINTDIFPDPAAVMRNIIRVTAHLERKVRADGGDPEREVVRVIPTNEGRSHFADPGGEVWRCFAKVENTSSHAVLSRPEEARAVTGAFGRFLRRIADMPSDSLAVPLEDFHDPSKALDRLRGIATMDPVGRARGVRTVLCEIERRAQCLDQWKALCVRSGASTRAVHNDPKVDNVLVDSVTGCGLCVIDLDTVMPGLVATDIGDGVRSVLTGHEGVGRPFDLRLFDAAVRGFFEGLGDSIDEAEIAQIVPASQLMTYELVIRFLADYIAGDRWFRASSRYANLQRARVQLALLQAMEANADEMTQAVERAAMDRRLRGE